MKRVILTVLSAVALLLTTVTPANASSATYRFADGCTVNALNGWNGSYPWAVTNESSGCYKMKTGIHYQRASNGVWYYQESGWASISPSRHADYAASRYDWSRHFGDANLSDCCFYWSTLYR